MRLRHSALAATLLALWGSAACAADIHREWVTENGRAKVRIGPCGQELCGVIVWIRPEPDRPASPLDAKNPDPALRSRPITGLQMLKGFKPAGPGRWAGGSIYDPQSGRTYASKLALTPDGALKVEGCVTVICQAQTWRPASSSGKDAT